MLVLTRKRNQAVRIGEYVTVTVISVGGDKVKLGIDAPRHVPVHRSEVFDAIKREKEK